MKKSYMMNQKRKTFEHLNIDLGYEDLTAETTQSGRKYAAPNGKSYPSVTTVLSILSEEGIQKWRARVGEEEANKISYRASTRGTAVHSIIENYINNEEDYAKGFMPNIVDNFKGVQQVLDERIGRVYAQEAALYSDHLGLAGRETLCDKVKVEEYIVYLERKIRKLEDELSGYRSGD
jgi:hypothetical protein